LSDPSDELLSIPTSELKSLWALAHKNHGVEPEHLCRDEVCEKINALIMDSSLCDCVKINSDE
jgi:hypothetical protein